MELNLLFKVYTFDPIGTLSCLGDILQSLYFTHSSNDNSTNYVKFHLINFLVGNIWNIPERKDGPQRRNGSLMLVTDSLLCISAYVSDIKFGWYALENISMHFFVFLFFNSTQMINEKYSECGPIRLAEKK